MNKFVAAIALSIAGVFAAAPVAAADWTYVGVGYSYSDVKSNVTDRNVSADAMFGEVSVAVTDWMFVQGHFGKGMDQNFDSSVVGVSVGLNHAIDEKADVFGKVTATSVVENRMDLDKYAYDAEFGVRANVTDRLELRGGVIVTDLRDARVDSLRYMGTAGAEYALTPNIRLGADVRGKDNVLEGQVGVRLYF